MEDQSVYEICATIQGLQGKYFAQHTQRTMTQPIVQSRNLLCNIATYMT
jgi:hypothetical protein